MHGNRLSSTRPPSTLSARRLALLATTVAGFGAAALVFAPQADLFGTSVQARNLTDKVQQLAQRPVGFADIVEKVKPAVISVRVKLERPASAGPGGDDDLPFPPGSPFERFFRKFGAPNAPGGKEVVTGQGSGF